MVHHTCAVSDIIMHAYSVVFGEWAVSRLSRSKWPFVKPGIRLSPSLVDCTLPAPR